MFSVPKALAPVCCQAAAFVLVATACGTGTGEEKAATPFDGKAGY